MLENTLWTERYRPKNLDDYVGSEDFVGKVRTWIENQDIPHLLLHSASPGTGKTSAAKLIGNSLDADVLYINASDENNIETVRDKIKNFASSVGFGLIKIIILDEADYLTPNAMAALRNVIETFSKHTRFILTCVAAGTRIYSEYGFTLVENCNLGDSVKTYPEIESIQDIVKTVRSRKLHIKTIHGLNISVTSDHRFLSLGEEVLASNLKCGSVIDYNIGDVYGKDIELDVDKFEFDKNDFIEFLRRNSIFDRESINLIYNHKWLFYLLTNIDSIKKIPSGVELNIQTISRYCGLTITKCRNILTKLGAVDLIEYNSRTTYSIKSTVESDLCFRFQTLKSKLVNYPILDNQTYYKISRSRHLRFSIEDIIENLKFLNDLELRNVSSIVALSRIVGFIYGDGHLTNENIHFASNNDVTLSKVKIDLETLLGNVKFHIKKNGYINGNGLIAIYQDAKFCWFLKYLGCPIGAKVKQILNVPIYNFWNCNIFKKFFIQSLFDCESLTVKVHKNNKTITPIRFGQRVLKSIGDAGTLFVEICKFFDAHGIGYKYSIRDLEEYQQSRNNLTEQRIVRTIQIFKQCDIMNFMKVIGNWYESKKITYDYLGYLQYKSTQFGYKFLTFNQWKNHYYNNGSIVDEIIGIQEVFDDRSVYDLCFKDNHIYLTNGLKSHNCNYAERIIAPLQSRLISFHIQPPDKKSVALRSKYILEQESIKFDLKDVIGIVNQYYPDQRRIINALQRNSTTGELIIDNQSQLVSGYCEKILEQLRSNLDVKLTFINIRQIIADSRVRQFDDLFRFLFDNLEEFAAEGKRAQMILHIADCQTKAALVIDKEIQVAAMFINILRDLR